MHTTYGCVREMFEIYCYLIHRIIILAIPSTAVPLYFQHQIRNQQGSCAKVILLNSLTYHAKCDQKIS